MIAEGPPVPIPNTEVKLCRGEDTCLETGRDDSSWPTSTDGELFLTVCFLFSSLAQSVEHLTVNQGVTGSSPVGGANESISFS